MARRTKIVATIGPASESPAVLRALVDAGMDVARFSLSHAPLEDTLRKIAALRAVAPTVGVLADLPGPKIRAAEVEGDGVRLEEGEAIELVAAAPGDRSSAARIAVEGESVAALQPGDRVALGDGAIQLVVDAGGERVVATVATGGWIQGRPGVLLPPGRSMLSAPTADDLRLLEGLTGAVDAVAVSFVRSAADIDAARAVQPDAFLIAKIETGEAVEDLPAIVGAADAVMVARGDLGLRCAIEDVPHHQKRIIRTGVAFARPVITATQMLESMIRSPVPTRAEVSDIANAVFDGTSALMLSGETAIGHDPALAVATMARVAERAEREFDHEDWGARVERLQTTATTGTPAAVRTTAAVSAAAWRAALEADLDGIIACTNSGATARAISRFRPRLPIIAATPSATTARRLTMSWGITPLLTDRHGTTDDIVWFAVKAAREAGLIGPDSLVGVLVGSPTEPGPTTDTLRLVRVS